jgi:ferredoxin
MAPPPTAAQDAVVANHALRLEQNAPGAYFVDSSCIDCDLCRQIAPETFGRDRHAAQSIVRAQPAVDAARLRASMALVACPTSSIGSSDKAFARDAAAAFPEAIDGEVSFVGYAASRRTYATTGSATYELRVGYDASYEYRMSGRLGCPDDATDEPLGYAYVYGAASSFSQYVP